MTSKNLYRSQRSSFPRKKKNLCDLTIHKAVNGGQVVGGVLAQV